MSRRDERAARRSDQAERLAAVAAGYTHGRLALEDPPQPRPRPSSSSRISRAITASTIAAAVMLAALVALALTFAGPIAGPAHVCHGYVEIPPKHVNSDLYGGAITQWLPKCHEIP